MDGFSPDPEKRSSMSKPNEQGGARDSEQDLRDEVFAADDTGMVHSEADVVTAELQEALEPLETDAEEPNASLP